MAALHENPLHEDDMTVTLARLPMRATLILLRLLWYSRTIVAPNAGNLNTAADSAIHAHVTLGMHAIRDGPRNHAHLHCTRGDFDVAELL